MVGGAHATAAGTSHPQAALEAATRGELPPEPCCSVHAKLEVVAGEAADYASLAAYHYRDERPTAIKAVFLLRPKRPLGSFGTQPAGVIVYGMPNPRVALRRVATNGLFAGLDRQTELALINRNVRCIARVIIEPRFRGIGLATRLVRETLARMETPIIEALAVCGAVNPFLERAGMTAFAPRSDAYHAELIEALSAVGIEAGRMIIRPYRSTPTTSSSGSRRWTAHGPPFSNARSSAFSRATAAAGPCRPGSTERGTSWPG